jgi:hypothetical protein
MPKFRPLPPIERLNELLKVVEIPEDKFGIWSGLVRKVNRGGRRTGSVAGTPHQDTTNPERKDWEVRIDRVSYFASRVIYYMTTGEDPGDAQVDHIDQNWLNNNAWNLRLDVDGSVQQVNRPKFKNNTSGIVGVSWDKSRGKWKAQVNENKKRKNLGYFVCKIEAARVVNDKWVENKWDKKGRQLNDLESVKCNCECCVRGSRETSDT